MWEPTKERKLLHDFQGPVYQLEACVDGLSVRVGEMLCGRCGRTQRHGMNGTLPRQSVRQRAHASGTSTVL